MRLTSFAVSLMLTAGIALAQPGPPPGGVPGAQPAGDPPSRVARLNYIDGNVSFQPAGVDTWTEATMNYPLTTGDHIYADVGAHAEMHIGPNALRIGSQSNFGYLNLNDRTVQISLTEGALEVRLRRLDDDDLYEIDTPQGAVSLLRSGDYRIETDPGRNATMVTVRAGEAEVTAGGTAFPVHPRQTGYFADGAQPDIRDANPPDAFDDFTSARNRDEERIPPPTHVPTAMIGYQDLDANGVWRNEPAYGWVWFPRVQPGWAPYRHGHWAWVEPWGWTWIDNASWGFAPFHYGRWVNLGGVWAWVPGSGPGRPVYAPALVAFVGGPGFGVGFGVGGGVAWFPLGPREPFIPAYHVSNVYMQQVNITHVNVTTINVTNVRYVNQGIPSAVTAVPQAAFVGARPVAAAAMPVTSQQLASAQVMGTAPRVVPVRESVLGSGQTANAVVPHPPSALAARQVVTRTPAPPAPVSFAAKQQALQANGGRPLGPEQVQQIRAQQPAAASRPAAMPSQATPAQANPTQAAPVNRMESRPPSAQRPAAPASVTPAPAAATPAPASRPAPAAEPASRPAPAGERKSTAKPRSKKDEKKEEKKP